MQRQVTIWALGLALMSCTQALGGEEDCHAPRGPHFLRRLSPSGGWHPYGGGLLHWWNPQCFPRCGGRDDYCCKPLPKVCWPPYPPYYRWEPPEIGHP
jgi:hypothetical protein